MERLIFGGVVVISLAIFACAAPQFTNAPGDQQQQASAGNGKYEKCNTFLGYRIEGTQKRA